MTATEIEAFLLSELSSLLGLASGLPDENERFVSYGLDSAGAVLLAARLSTFLHRALPATLVWQHATARELAVHLAAESCPAGAAERERAARRASPLGRHDVGGYDIAVIGIGCRFPRADDAAAYWGVLKHGVDTIGDAPSDRWPVSTFFDADGSVPGKTVTRWGGFVEHALDFDPQAFGISPREAEHMDPQQRVALEVAWRAFEDAGLPSAALRDAKVGVFVGAMWTEYGWQLCPTLERVSSHTVTGLDTSIISARISYVFGLAGASMTVNTACSSSLVSLHLACQSLLLGESELALAGGVSLMLSPFSSVAMSKFGAMSPRARCRAFDAGADGYVRGEGCGFAVLKPLRRALEDGDAIRCVIRGSAVNNDGFSNGLTAPSPRAQEAVIAAACARAGLAHSSLHYVETHGPGTILGDPMEAGALGRTLGNGRSHDRALLIGSAKTNLGHLEAAAGIAGFLKLSLALQHREVPPNLHFDSPNPHIPFAELRLRVNTRHAPWPEPGVATGGVNAFGFGGTNCHVVAQEQQRSQFSSWPLAADSAQQLVERIREVTVSVSGASEDACLDAQCRDAAARLGRGHHRIVLSADSPAKLRASARGPTPEPAPSKPQVVFVCPGQGGQWQGMCLGLIAEEPVFRAQIAACADAIARHAGWSLWDQLFAATNTFALERADVVQPMVFAVQVALCAQLRSWGVEPDVLIGHSMGEVAAAHLAGILSLDDATRVICVRSRLASAAAGDGGMAVVGLGGAATLDALQPYADKLSVAAYNSHESTVVSGEREALQELVAELQGRAVYAAQISVDFASHSAQMDPLREPLMEGLAALQTRQARIRMISTVSTETLAGPECGSSYWADNLREPVRLMHVVDQCLAAGPTVFVELSPHPVLAQSLNKQVQHASAKAQVLAVMRRDEPERTTLTAAAARLFELGIDVDWVRVAGPGKSLSALDLETARPRIVASREQVVLTLSARSEAALRGSVAAYRDHLAQAAGPVCFLDDIVYTANTRRSPHRHRVAVVGTTAQEMHEALSALASGQSHPAAFEGDAPAGSACEPVWLIPEPRLRWSRALINELARNDAFVRGLASCELALRARIDWSVVDELAIDRDDWSDRLERLEICWFAVQMALADVWQAHGVCPRALAGRGTGELVAACLCGALTLDDAARVLAARAQLLQQSPPELARAMVLLHDTPAEHAALQPALQAAGQRLERTLAGLVARKSARPFFSGMEGRALGGFELGARYWARNLSVASTGFRALLQSLAEVGQCAFVELSPVPSMHAEVSAALSASEEERTPLVVPTQVPGAGRILAGLAALFSRGAKVDLHALHEAGGRVVEVPGYQFHRQRYWPERPAPTAALLAPVVAACPMLGQPMQTPLARAAYQTVLTLRALPFMRDHVVYDTAVVSGAQYVVSMLAAAGRELRSEQTLRLSDLQLIRSLPLGEQDAVAVQTSVEDTSAGAFRIKIASQDASATAAAGQWRTHCEANASAALAASAERPDLRAAWARCDELLDRASFYQQWEDAGYKLGQAFRAIETLARRDGEAVATLHMPADGFAADSPLACGLIDSLFQLIAMAGPGGAKTIGASKSIYAPVSVRELTVHRRAFDGVLGAHATVQLEKHSDAAAAAPDTIYGDAVLTDASGEALVTVAGLCLRRAPRAALLGESRSSSVHGLRYSVEHSRVAAAGTRKPEGVWAVLAPAGGESLARALLARIEASGARGVLLGLVAGESPEAYALRLDSVIERLGTELSEVVFLGRSVEGGADDAAADDAVGVQAATCGTLVWLVRSLSRASLVEGRRTRLHVVTRGAQVAAPTERSSGGTPAAYACRPGCLDATLWGLSSVVAVEHPELCPKRIDLDPLAIDVDALEAASAGLDALWNELLTSDEEDQILLRGGARLAPRLTPFAPRDEAAGASWGGIEADATQLVTGGQGGIGLKLAEWLVEQGARHLVLAGRSRPSERALAVQAALQRQGATVVFAELDVSEAADIEGLFQLIAQEMPPLRGVFHAAGILDDGLLENLTWEQFQRVLAPKVAGAVHLDRLTASLSLRHFVVFSSVAALLGLAGQANYAAANAFIDALVHDRRARGLPALTMNWGPWSEVGLAAAEATRGGRLAARGLASLAPGPSLELLGRALGSSHAQVVVMPFDATAWCKANPQVRSWPLLARLGARGAEPAASKPVRRSELRLKLERARTPRQRAVVLTSFLRDDAARVLRLSSSDVQQDSPLVAQGMDSLMSQEFRNSLAFHLEQKLPASLLWNFPTIRALAEELGRLANEDAGLATKGESAGVVSRTPRASFAKGALAIAGLDEAEVTRLVDRNLNRNRTGA